MTQLDLVTKIIQVEKICLNKKMADSKAMQKYAILEGILMENAANNIAQFIKKHINNAQNFRTTPNKKNIKDTKSKKNIANTKIIFIIGRGNNGADGLAASRILQTLIKNDIAILFLCDKKDITSYLKTPLAKKHFETLQNLDINFYFKDYKILDSLHKEDIIIDCIFGSGYKNNEKKPDFIDDIFLQSYKNCHALKIALDIASMIGNDLKVSDFALSADITLALGAFEIGNIIKDHNGILKLLPIGIKKEKYYECFESSFFLLHKKLNLINDRYTKNVHKGSFGYSTIINGNMSGASNIAALSALNFGVGISAIYTQFCQPKIIDKEIVYTQSLTKANAIAVGMGLDFDDMQYQKLFEILKNCNKNNFVFDADMMCKKELIDFLLEFSENKNIILTPHPKELFAFLENLKNVCENKNINKDSKIIKNKNRNHIANEENNKYHTQDFDFTLCKDFESMLKNLPFIAKNLSLFFKNVVFILKDSNMFIAQNGVVFINMHGRNNLAKAGSGDVLSGLAVSLLAQNFSAIESGISASLILSLCSIIASKKYANFALTPTKIIKILSKITHKDLKLLKL